MVYNIIIQEGSVPSHVTATGLVALRNVTGKSDDSMEVTLRAVYIALQIGPFIALIFALP